MENGTGDGNWLYYLDAMITFARKAYVYTQRLEQRSFVGNDVVFDATVRNLELLGEAATHIPDETRAANEHIPWGMLIATRERLMRSDGAIDWDVIWTIVDDDIPPLIPALQSLRESVAGSA
jgi:uncharacterized protein with HEPN domain